MIARIADSVHPRLLVQLPNSPLFLHVSAVIFLGVIVRVLLSIAVSTGSADVAKRV